LRNLLTAALLSGLALLVFIGSVRTVQQGLHSGKLPHFERFQLFPKPGKRKNPLWFWFNFSVIIVTILLVWSLFTWAVWNLFQPA
jgi:hypothetical protein